jgi:hypothetical protein
MVRLSEKLTIVIPSKDEKWIILDCLELISQQIGIEGTRVIIADSSEIYFSQYILKNFSKRFKSKLNIDIIRGGLPSEARLFGSRCVTTPFVLFLDADICLLDNKLLQNIFDEKFLTEDIDLLTTNITTDSKYDLYYRVFDFIQKISLKINSPFAVGSFQLWRLEAYWNTGGFVPTQKFAEDYWLSKQVNPKAFKVFNTNKVWTYPRRFKKKSKLYMIKMLIKSYLNRNNPSFFDKDHDYWK